MIEVRWPLVPKEGSFSAEWLHAEAVEQGEGEERERGWQTAVLESGLMEKGRGQGRNLGE